MKFEDSDICNSALNISKGNIKTEDLLNLFNAKGDSVLLLMELASNKFQETALDNKEVTYSKNVFLPVTNICQNDCGYCTFKKKENSNEAIILKDEKEIISSLKESENYGCKEALFTLGEYADTNDAVKSKLKDYNFDTMVDYIYYLCEKTLDETNLLPHTNMGILNYDELKMLKEVNASMGLMLENSSERLMETITHEKSPGKDPKKRLELIANAGKLKIPYTTGILIGIGETLEERAKSLMDIRDIQDKYGHIQELIIQNFRSKPGIAMENYKEPSLIDMIKTVSIAKLMFPDLSIQVPPNLNYETSQIFLLCGCDDWGGVSPISKDFVNPEAPWPELSYLKDISEECGYAFKERLCIYDKYINKNYLSDKVLMKAIELNNYIY